MVKTTFKKILGKTKYSIDRSIVETTLKELGYSVRECSYGIEAIKWEGNNRYHFIIDTFPDGNIYKDSYLLLHEDINSRIPFHPISYASNGVAKEFNRFQDLLMEHLKKQNEL